MKNAKRVIIPVVIVLVVLLALNSCKDTLGAVIDQATGKADTVQEEDTTQWAELTSDPLSLEGIGDPSAKYAAAAVNSCLNIVFTASGAAESVTSRPPTASSPSQAMAPPRHPEV